MTDTHEKITPGSGCVFADLGVERPGYVVPDAWRYRYEQKEGVWGKWTVQKNKPTWWSAEQPDVQLEPLFSAEALSQAHQDGIREGKRQAAEILRAYPPDAFFTALNGATDGVGPVHEFRGFDGDAGNWAYLMSVILEPYALAVLSTIPDEAE